MEDQVQDHFSDDEIVRLEIEPDLERWKERLEFNTSEIAFMKKLLSYNNKVKINSNLEYSENLLQDLDKIEQANNVHFQDLLDFKNSIHGLWECDEVQCENQYIKEYLLLKEKLQEHFKNIRTGKVAIYKYLEGGLEAS